MHTQTKLFLLAAFFASFAPLSALAVIYQPGETLNPSCLPTDVNCGVDATSFSSGIIVGTNAPAVTTNTLYQSGGVLYWNGSTLSMINNSHWSGTQLAVANGGTGQTTLTANALLMGNGTGAIAASTVGTDGQLLIGQSSAAPLWKSSSGDVTVDKNGVLTIGAGKVTNAMLANSTISGIALGSNLATLTFGTYLTGTSYNGSTAVTIATNATNANTASTLVARDASGNFSAGTITAALSGNASTATALQTARTINGISFDGTADITVSAAAGTLTGTTAVGSGGTGLSSLTSNYLYKGNGTSALAQSLLYDTGTNVGIGNATASSTLEVSGSFNAWTTGRFGGAVTLANVTGSTQCLHVDSLGVITGTGSDCGSGGGITSLNGLIGFTQTFSNDTNVTIASSGTTHTLGWSGTLAVSRGGTGTSNGSITGTGALSFTSNTSNALTLDSGTTGAINLGTNANAKTITLGNTTGATQMNVNAGTGGIFVTGLASQTNGKVTVCIDSSTKQLFTGATASSCNTSSERHKHDIADIDLGLDAVNTLRPVSYVYNSNNQQALGFIAEEAVLVDERLIVRDENGVIQAIDSDQFVPILTRGIQELTSLLGERVTSQSFLLVSDIRSESSTDPVEIIKKKIAEGKRFLTDFVAARVTAVRGYFDEVFARTTHQKTLCIGEPGDETCITKDQLDKFLQGSSDPVIIQAPAEPEPELLPAPEEEEEAIAPAETPPDEPEPVATSTETPEP